MAGGDKEKPVSWLEESTLKAATSCLGQRQGWMPTISLFSRSPQGIGLARGHPCSVETIAFQTGAVLGRGIRVQSPQPWQASAKALLSLLQPLAFVMNPWHSLPWPPRHPQRPCTAQADPSPSPCPSQCGDVPIPPPCRSRERAGPRPYRT